MSAAFVATASAILFLSARSACGAWWWAEPSMTGCWRRGVVGTNIVGLLVVIGFIFQRPDMFVDLALTYALLNFIGTVAAARYLARHPEDGA